MDKLLPFAAGVASAAASTVTNAFEWISQSAVATIESKLQPVPAMPALIECISPPPPAPLRDHLLSVLPELCGIIPPLADIVYEYLEGVKYPTFTAIPENYFPDSFDVCDASARGDLLQIQYCLEVLRVDPNLCTSPAKYARSSPICIAGAHGHLLCVQYLLSRGASPYSKDSYYRTALHAAAFNGQEEVALYLLKHHNFLQHAAEDAPKFLTKCMTQSRLTILHCAAIGGCNRLLKALVNEHGLHPDDSDNSSPHDSKTALHLAAERGRLSTVRCLVEELHADPTIRDWYGSSPLDLARLTRRVEPTSADLPGLSHVIQYLDAREAQ